MTVAILGGGLSGLTLARLLHERGADILIFEAEQQYGGLCRSKRTDGFTFDTGGSHIIFSRDQEVLGFMRTMIEGNEQRTIRNTKIFYKKRYVKYPFENGLYDLPDEDRFACINGFVRALIASEKGTARKPENFREWIYYTFGKGIAECYLVPYNEKIWKYPTEKMSYYWVEDRIPRPPVEDIIKSAIGIPTEGYTHQAVFSYPVEGGIESLVRAIARPIESSIRPKFNIISLERSETEWLISNGHETIPVDQVICTIPVQHLFACLQDIPPRVKKACEALKYNSLICVNIGIRGTVPDISWLYVPDHALGKANRVSFPSNYSNRVAPEGCASILAEITCRPGDAVSGMSDKQITDEVTEMLEKMNLCRSDQILYSSVERQPFAYIIYDLDYQKNIRIIRDYCTEAGIPLVGRFARFEYLNMDACIRDAMDFAATYTLS